MHGGMPPDSGGIEGLGDGADSNARTPAASIRPCRAAAGGVDTARRDSRTCPPSFLFFFYSLLYPPFSSRET